MIILLILIAFADSSSSDIFYVTRSGLNRETCGSRSIPCLTIRYTLSLCNSDKLYTIRVDGSWNESYLYEECNTPYSIYNQSIKIEGWRGVPTIGCDQFAAEDRIFAFNKSNIILENIRLLHGKVLMSDSTIKFKEVDFHNTSFLTSQLCNELNFSMENSTMRKPFIKHCEKITSCLTLSDYIIYCKNLKLSITNSRIHDTKLQIIGHNKTDVYIDSTYFEKVLKYQETDLGGLDLNVSLCGSKVLIKNSVFKSQRHRNPFKGAINMNKATLSFIGNPSEKRLLKEKCEEYTIPIVENCLFEDNERAITITYEFEKIIISHTKFLTNQVWHAGAAIRIAPGPNSLIQVDNCDFINNQGGLAFYDKDADIGGQIKVNGRRVELNCSDYRAVIDLAGKGGAIWIATGVLALENCTFLNNTSSLLGGSIFVDDAAALSLKGCRIENSDSDLHPQQGDMVYSNGKVKISSTVFKTKTAHRHVPVILLFGNYYWSIDVKDLYFECPTGQSVLIINASSYQVHRTGLKTSHQLDQLTYYCQTCDENQYSVDVGSLNYSVSSNQSDLLYDAIRIDSETPKQTHAVHYEYKDVTCHNCPFGGDCSRHIKAIPNFWGYIVKGKEVVFQHCPQNYCCSNLPCSSMSECAPFREGILCGRCRQGYSEGYFSTYCLLNKECTKWWTITLVVGLQSTFVVLLTILLLFHEDFEDFIKSTCCKRKSSVLKIPCENHIDLNDDTEPLNISKKTITSMQIGESSASEELLRKDESINDKNGLLIIFVYYLQDAWLLHIDTVYTNFTKGYLKYLKNMLSGFFHLRIDILFNFLEDFLGRICPIKDLTPILKVSLLSVDILGFFILFLFLFIISKLLKNSGTVTGSRRSFKTRLTKAFTVFILFIFQKMTITAFKFLNCIDINDEKVLFIDGTVKCYQPFQLGIIGLVTLFIIPIPLVIMFGPRLLKEKLISLGSFFFGCLFPLPTFAIWIYKYRKQNATVKVSPESEALLDLLQSPFKQFGATCWSGKLMIGRLLLILFYSFINNSLYRLLCMLSCCCVTFWYIVQSNPYTTSKSNTAAILSSAALVAVAGINLVKAGFESAEYHPQGPNWLLVTVFEQVENILLVWFPLLISGLTILLIICKLLSCIMCRKKRV
ncbi:DgyrCDS2010 [Dimorphilus gyrociliatus]|uniref:DgyrCDS2010 n=1 Tax=Dimorphilus gyrociliatus TaxID=2664684 RepID=A0A7I8VBT5_9ANNE|nr:DgyrCDS2010 [Dimorphilus gyrociliatus]